MEDGELGLRPHRLENSPVVRLAEALILFLAVEGEAGRLDGVEDAFAALAEARVHEGEDGLGDGGEGVGDRLGIFLEIVAEPVPPASLRASESGLNTVGTVEQSARLSTTVRMMVSRWVAQPDDSIFTGRTRFQSSGALTPWDAQGRWPSGRTSAPSTQPQSSTA
jgi:hypothetical protein